MKVKTVVDFCCNPMKYNFGAENGKPTRPFGFGQDGKVALIYLQPIGGYNPISYCPWCGKEIRYEQE